MLLLRYLQHWLTGRGPCLQVADFVPETHPIRQWADTVPWATLVAAVDRSFTRRFPKPTARGRPPVSTRVLLALELLKHELACSDEQICSRLRTDLAVMYACGITQVQVDGSQEHFVLPDVLAQFRSRLDAPLMEELLAIQAATAMEEGLVSPAHVVVDTFPREQAGDRPAGPGAGAGRPGVPARHASAVGGPSGGVWTPSSQPRSRPITGSHTNRDG
jgi:transposase